MVRSSRTMPWLARRPTFERTVDFLTELPIWIVELILRMSLNKTNYKALKFIIGSGKVARIVQKEVLTLIDNIIKEDKFVRRELSFEIRVSHLVETAKWPHYLWQKDQVFMVRNLTDDRKNYSDTGFADNDGIIEDIQMITQGYDCLQLLCIHQGETYNHVDYYEKPKILILNFWKMYHFAKENNIVQQIIDAVRLVKENKKSKLYGHSKLSFTVELVCREIKKKNTNTAEKEEIYNELDIFIRLELIALDMKLLQHVDDAYVHVAKGTTHPYEWDIPHTYCPRYFCLCKEEGWVHGNSGNMSSWSLITILARTWDWIDGRRWVKHPLPFHLSR